MNRTLRDLTRSIRDRLPEGVGFALFGEGVFLSNADRTDVANAIAAARIRLVATAAPHSAEQGPRAFESGTSYERRLSLERQCVELAQSLAAGGWPGAFMLFLFDGGSGGRFVWKTVGHSSTLEATIRTFVETHATPAPAGTRSPAS